MLSSNEMATKGSVIHADRDCAQQWGNDGSDHPALLFSDLLSFYQLLMALQKRDEIVLVKSGLQEYLEFVTRTGGSTGETWALSHLEDNIHACHVLPAGAEKKYVI